MTQMSFSRPLCKLELRDKHGTDPPAVAHLLFREPLSKAPAVCLRKVHERALRDFKLLELREQRPPRSRREAAACSGHIRQSFALVITEHQSGLKDCRRCSRR